MPDGVRRFSHGRAVWLAAGHHLSRHLSGISDMPLRSIPDIRINVAMR